MFEAAEEENDRLRRCMFPTKTVKYGQNERSGRINPNLRYTTFVELMTRLCFSLFRQMDSFVAVLSRTQNGALIMFMFSIRPPFVRATVRGTGRANVVDDPPATPAFPLLANASYLKRCQVFLSYIKTSVYTHHT